MEGRKILETLLYLGFGAAASVFLKETVEDFLDGAATFTEEKQPLTLHDLPTLTICLDFKKSLSYGKDITFDATVKFSENSNETISTQLENGYVQILANLAIHLRKLRLQTSNLVWQIQPNYQCFKISPSWKGNEVVELQKFELEIVLKLPNGSAGKCHGGSTFITSEDNAYGATRGRWFDGQTYIIGMPPSQLDKKSGLHFWGKNEFEIGLEKIREYNHLESTCSKDSYYKCLAKRLKEFNYQQNVIKAPNGSKCFLKSICAPFSLPMADDEIPYCENDLDQAFHEQVLLKLQSDQEKHCKQSCQVKEFQARTRKMRHNAGDFQDSLQYYMVFKFQPEYESKDRHDRPMKTVFTERLLISPMSLVGNVGGTLGMCIEFSFIGSSAWIITLLEKLLGHLMKIC